jgi:hypothetical protein
MRCKGVHDPKQLQIPAYIYLSALPTRCPIEKRTRRRQPSKIYRLAHTRSKKARERTSLGGMEAAEEGGRMTCAYLDRSRRGGGARRKTKLRRGVMEERVLD